MFPPPFVVLVAGKADRWAAQEQKKRRVPSQHCLRNNSSENVLTKMSDRFFFEPLSHKEGSLKFTLCD
jgi:hypothetical protein